MKNRIFNFIMVTIIFTLFTSSVFAQGSRNQVKELYETVIDMKNVFPTKREIATFRPENKKQAEQLHIISDAVKLIDRIDATNGRMTPRVKANFDRELILLEKALGLTMINTSGKPATCHGGCDQDYPGTGGGVGWRRFMCKLACIKICIGNLCASGGN